MTLRHVGYPEWERPRQGTETGRWDPRQERWIPQQRAPERDGHYGIEPFPARSDPRKPGHGRVLDHDDWVEADTEDEDEPDQRSVYIGSFVSTGLWYLIPLALYTGWSFTQSAQSRPGCTNAFGLPCPSPRAEALSHIVSEIPAVAIAMAVSIVIAMILGKVTRGWRPFAIGFASAVLGAGLATVAIAVLKTQFTI